MAHCHQDDEDEITQADDTADAATFGGSSTRGPRQVTPPDDLRSALAMPTTFGPSLFEISTLHAVSAACLVKVKDAGDLLLLRDWLFEELGPPYMWTVMLSVVEWEHLTDYQKELHSTMRESWLSSYSKSSHTVLQHWLGRFLKKQTKSFAPLHIQKSRLTRLTVVICVDGNFPFVPRHWCIYRAQAPRSWPQDVPQLQK
jgi:hypothetical protein